MLRVEREVQQSFEHTLKSAKRQNHLKELDGKAELHTVDGQQANTFHEVFLTAGKDKEVSSSGLPLKLGLGLGAESFVQLFERMWRTVSLLTKKLTVSGGAGVSRSK